MHLSPSKWKKKRSQKFNWKSNIQTQSSSDRMSFYFYNAFSLFFGWFLLVGLPRMLCLQEDWSEKSEVAAVTVSFSTDGHFVCAFGRSSPVVEEIHDQRVPTSNKSNWQEQQSCFNEDSTPPSRPVTINNKPINRMMSLKEEDKLK